MKTTIIRQQPVPPVDKIVLELTPAEFVRLRRKAARGLGTGAIHEPLVDETAEARALGDRYATSLDRDMRTAARDAGLAVR